MLNSKRKRTKIIQERRKVIKNVKFKNKINFILNSFKIKSLDLLDLDLFCLSKNSSYPIDNLQNRLNLKIFSNKAEFYALKNEGLLEKIKNSFYNIETTLNKIHIDLTSILLRTDQICFNTQAPDIEMIILNEKENQMEFE
jgi:hypothetical protein